jgi:hypothetical protein
MRIVVAAQNWALDAAMQGGAVASVPLAFIDVDEETWRSPQWGKGEPYRAPRDDLLRLIEYAVGSPARYIVVDVIVEGSSGPDDERFAKAIAQLAGHVLRPDQHILFVRTLREPLSGMQNLLAPELRSSLLDPVIRDYPKQLHAVAPYFRISRDGVLRDWQMWRLGCRSEAGTGKGHWEFLPSVQLTIGALVASYDKPDDKGRADRAKFPWHERAGLTPCIVDFAAYMQVGVPTPKLRPDDTPMWDWLPESGIANASEIEPPNDEPLALSNRIFYRFRYRQEQSEVRLIPALAILEHRRLDELAKNSVVIIGQSFEAARDQHATPLGAMPGAMVLANSVDSVLKPGLLREPGLGLRILIELDSIVLIGGILAFLDYLPAFCVILVLFVPVLIGVNYCFLSSGVWVDFAVPLLGMYAHWIIVEIEAYLPRRRGRAVSAVHHNKEV